MFRYDGPDTRTGPIGYGSALLIHLDSGFGQPTLSEQLLRPTKRHLQPRLHSCGYTSAHSRSHALTYSLKAASQGRGPSYGTATHPDPSDIGLRDVVNQFLQKVFAGRTGV